MLPFDGWVPVLDFELSLVISCIMLPFDGWVPVLDFDIQGFYSVDIFNTWLMPFLHIPGGLIG
jgi:hypothetical protein